MTYTSSGGSVDLSVTAAVEFQVKKSDSETNAPPDALHQSGSTYSRIDLAGKISISSHRSRNAELEVTRYVLGAADSADHDAKLEKMNGFEDRCLPGRRRLSLLVELVWLAGVVGSRQWDWPDHLANRTGTEGNGGTGICLALFLA